ncbi:MAG: LysM peptidoglycan-binding domain-containing protein [Clostridia bacterium]|nr:LysM peptidoglycan-binding domain-containing protein [Clostridia bacterium]
MEIVRVQPGETLEQIAARYGISAALLAAENGFAAEVALAPGQTVVVLIPSQVYTVQAGDTLFSIAQSGGISVKQLLRNNPPLQGGAVPIFPGQTLVIDYTDTPRRTLSVNGYAYPNVSLPLLRAALPYLTYLTIFSYGIRPDGSLLPIVGDDPLIAAAQAGEVAPLMMLTTLGEDGRFNNELSSVLLADETLQETLLSDVVATMRAKGYQGLDIDFEFVRPQEREAYAAFITRAADRLNAEGYPVMVALAPKISDDQEGLLYEAHDYAALGAAANNALLMTYEWGYTYGPPMAVAPINKVEEVVAYAVSRIPREKLFLGVPNYGYDWPLPFVRGETQAMSIGNLQGVELARRYGVPIEYDPLSQAPFLNYTDEQDVAHVVWFEDADSVRAKLDLAEAYGLRGVSVWNLMRDFPQARTVLSALYDVRAYTPGDLLL